MKLSLIRACNIYQIAMFHWTHYGWCYFYNFGIDNFGNTYQREIIKKFDKWEV